MAGGGDGERGDKEAFHQNQAEHAPDPRGLDPDAKGDHGASEAEEMEGTGDGAERVRLNITARRVRIDPSEKRRSYIRRLEKVMADCDKIASDPQGYEEIQVKAMAVLIRAVRVCYDIITDIEVEMIEAEAEEVKRLLEERARAVQGNA